MDLSQVQLIVELLKSDPKVKSETVRIEMDGDEVLQVEFYTIDDEELGDPSGDDGPTYSTVKKIESMGTSVVMNDCEWCRNEGVVWFK